jgi:hypothetical protein
MKKIIASAGLVAVSTAGLQAAAPGLSPMETAKPWSISATLRGFYDDNYTAIHKSAEDDSFGIELRPAVGLNFPFEQSFVGLSYVYSLRWYESRDGDSDDQSHEVTLKADHRFSERFSVDFSDSFVYSREPTVIDEDAAATAFEILRTDADAMRNRLAVEFDAQLTELVGLGLGYRNNWYDYDQEGPGSRSALLDRFEHDFNIEGRWHARENLFASVGYGLEVVSYTDDELISRDLLTGDEFFSEDRDNVQHRIYVGAEQQVSTQFKVSGKVGGKYTDFTEIDESDVSPWVEATGTYNYLPGSYFQFGLSHDRNATDRAEPAGGEPVTDQQSSSIFASITHRITPRLDGSIIGRFQRSEFNDGLYDGEIDNFLMLGLNLEYRFNPNWSTEVGYNYDRLDSDLPVRSFTRNRVYAGVRATY